MNTRLGSWGIVLVPYTAYNISKITTPQAHSLSVQGSRVPVDRESDMEIATDTVTAYASGARTVLRSVFLVLASNELVDNNSLGAGAVAVRYLYLFTYRPAV